MPSPTVSIVMSVYNDATRLSCAVESVLAQSFRDFEFIIVDDGSADDSQMILKEYAKQDSRIQILEQENAGLTRALIRGCSQARGQYIARQDADDFSYPTRLATLVELMQADDPLALVASWSETVGPVGELLYVSRRETAPEAARQRLLEDIVGPPGHGSAMFRRDAYEAVGGYRESFYYCQDYDLWLRLAQVGGVAFAPSVLYRYEINEDSISGGKQTAKEPYIELVLKCHQRRLQGLGDGDLLAIADSLPRRTAYTCRNSKAATSYFIAKNLMQRGDKRAQQYLWKAIRANPFHLRAWGCLTWSYCGLQQREVQA